jgi:nitrogen fixation NifU-like protein
MYNDKVKDYFLNPRNVGAMENPDAVGEVGNTTCGDVMRIYLKIEDERITDISFETYGCAAAIATSSIATEMVKGKTLDEAVQLKNRDVIQALGELPPEKIHCSVLAEEAIKAAVEDYRQRTVSRG